jgi:transposase InsO family protein
MNKKQTPEDVAGKRLMMITPLLDEGLDHSRLIELKKRISDDQDISYRTLTRYLQAYEHEGFQGLKPKSGYKCTSSSLPEDFPAVVDHAIILRREVPSRSVKDIIRILEMEDVIKPGTVHRSTLQRHLQAAGFGQRQVKMYAQKGVASSRFEKANRNDLWQTDLKYGPYLPIGKDGSMKQVYLSAFIDDATRYVVCAKFYDNQRTGVVEDSLRSAVMKFGKPKKLLTDNGSQYKSEWLKKACDRLGIKLRAARPYRPQTKGKIEFFNKRVDSFLAEAALNKPRTLEELNESFDLWLNEYYHKSPHSALGSVSPESVFRSDKQPMEFISAQYLTEAFLHTQTRRVDKIGCISFEGAKYEVGAHLLGREVEVYYDPSWMDEVEIHHKDFKPFKAKRQVIGENCSMADTSQLASIQPLSSNGSRLLAALNKDNITNRTNKEIAIRFKDMGGDSHV